MATVIGNFINWMRSEADYRARVSRHNVSALQKIMQPGYREGWQNDGRRGYLSLAGQGEDSILARDYPSMVAGALDLYRNSPFARSIVDTVRRYIGESHPEAMTSDAEWNKRATGYFNEYWWQACDARRRAGVDFGTIQQHWNYCAFTMGDMLFLAHKGTLYPFEGLQIATPGELAADRNIVNGIRVRGAFPHDVTHYYVCEAGKYGEVNRHKYQRLNRSDAFYTPTHAWRPSMLRAVPDLHGVIDALRDFDDTCDGVRSKVKFDTMLLTKERKGAVSTAGGRLVATGDNDSKTEITKAGNLMRVKVNGSPDDFQVHNMDNPNAAYVPFMGFDARIISSGIGFPVEIALHEYTNGSYTANRAARCDFKKYILERWQWRGKVLNQPVYNWVIANAILRGKLPPAPVDQITGISEWYKSSWSLPKFEQIDEQKDAAGDQKRWELGQDSGQDWAQEQGLSMETMLGKRDAFIDECQKRADARGMTLSEYMPGLFKQAKTEKEQNGD